MRPGLLAKHAVSIVTASGMDQYNKVGLQLQAAGAMARRLCGACRRPSPGKHNANEVNSERRGSS